MKRLRWIKRKRRLQTSLVFDFIAVNIALFFILITYLVLAIVDAFSHSTFSSESVRLDTAFYENAAKSGKDLQRLEKSGGWLELLSEDRRIVRIVGQPGEVRQGYTATELLRALSNAEGQRYYYAIAPVSGNDVKDSARYLLFKAPMERVSADAYLQTEPFAQNGEADTSPRSQIYFYGAVGLILLVIVLYSYWVARRIRKPLNAIARGLGRMTAGDLGARLEIRAEREFRQIGDAFNYMASELERTTREKKQLEESRQRLIVDLSHDLQTPITSIRGYSQALLEGRISDKETGRRYVEYIYRKSGQLTVLVRSMLELFKLDSPDYRLKLVREDVADVLRETVADMYEDVERNGFGLRTEIPDRAVYAVIEREALHRVLANLIGNALKYNPPGTELRIELREEADVVRIEIADTGVGIAPDLRNRIFDPFVRGDESRGGEGGTGLGLSIAERLLQKMGGSIKLLPEGEGREIGVTTTFVVSLAKTPRA
ncbi:sensor histidine kinase [Cohnella terricola]|uniref:histidine kinase n=1 Tax=Cohnella terricola TaxID=1289167 RepID=A0A559JWM4_9BACL|nr:HAMP domain-containing sensor histidine kinase [Cohnella terricola]TVY04295.1 HAMP domain-containing histidine kinase [Cohnella terricola]